MPALSAPQLALLRSAPQTSNWYCVPIVPTTIFAAQINGSPAVGAVTIPYDTVTTGAFADVLQGMTLWVGTSPDSYDIATLRIRLPADATNLYVAWNSDIAWADNYYLTVKQQYLPWAVRQRIVPPAIYKDYNIAYTDQTNLWPPVAMMGDNVCKLWTGNPTTVYFDGSESYAVASGATITSYAWDFGDGGNSAVMTPSNHPYTAAGTYYPTLTVGDSNGKTHLTRRIVSLPDPATLYTVNFEQTSLDAAIDSGWSAKARVFDPNASTANFPERAPCFIIATDSYANTVGSVGFSSDRENIVMFGYIAEGSVAVQPEYNEVTFDIESIAGVMARADSTPVFLSDSSNPAGEPDAWAWGKNLNVFRGLVFLLKFHSTVMDIADVQLYNDTTLTKMVDYPQDNLWNMLVQFGKGKRLMHTGVTRTGRIIVGRDPNLTPVASRGAFTTVCQLVDGDWREQVTIPQKPFPTTSFCCISGLVYSGNPADEPNPVFGMSPGRPPKEYGSEKEMQFLKLVDQTECNTLAGLIVGTDNMPYGDIVIPMRGNWTRCFDPARQEYVQAPAGGFNTKRGTLIANVLLIVRKVSVKFDWTAGVMQPTLTCDYYSYPEISVNGDCFPPDAPPYPYAIPGGNIIIPPTAPKPTGSGANYFSRGIWTLFNSSDIYKLTSVSPAGGSVVSKPAWSTGLGLTHHAWELAPAKSTILDMVADNGTNIFHIRSTNDGETWGRTDTNIPIGSRWPSIKSDRTNHNLVWTISDVDYLTTAQKTLFANNISLLGTYSNASAAGLVNWYLPTENPLYIWISTDGGASWSSVLLDYLYALLPTRIMYKGSDYGYMSYSSTLGGNSEAFFDAKFCSGYPNGEPGDVWGHASPPLMLGMYLNASCPHPYIPIKYMVCTSILNPPAVENLYFYPPSGQAFLCPTHNGSESYIVLSCAYGNSTFTKTTSYDSTGCEGGSETITQYVTPLAYFDGANGPGTSFISYIYKINSALSVSRKTIGSLPIYYAVVDITNTDRLFFNNNDGTLRVYSWSSNTYVSQSIPGGSVGTGLFVTSQGTLLVSLGNAHIERTTDQGSTWTDIDLSALSSYFEANVATEYGGTVGTPGWIVIPSQDNNGKYLYSSDDGITWNVTGDLVTHNWVNANSAR